MSSEVDIANIALTLLGENRITSLDDDVKPAREMKAIFTSCRDALLSGYTWSFAKARAQLPALVDVPVFGFDLQYQLPSDPYCLRIVMVGDIYAGIDLGSYSNSPNELFTIEGRRILTDLEAPLNLLYIRRVTDTSEFSATFVEALAGKLAAQACEAITQSGSKSERAVAFMKSAISVAVRSNAIELPPIKQPDDEWLLSRL